MSENQAPEKSLEELGAAVVIAKRIYAVVCMRNEAGLEDSEIVALTIERQRAVTVLVRAEAALADACRKELA